MKPPVSGMSFRGRGDDDGGEVMSWLEMGQDGEGVDIPEAMTMQQPQETKKVDADFFNTFDDDFDEDDMNPTSK
jgi:hypothetical protein